MPLPDLRREEKAVAQDVVGHVAEVGLVPVEAAHRAEKEVQVEGDEPDARDFTWMEAMLVEEVGDVRSDLDHREPGEVRDMHEHSQVVHGLGDGNLELFGERRVRGRVQDEGRQLHQRLAMASLAEAPSAADKVEALRAAVLLEEAAQGDLHLLAGEVREQLADWQPSGEPSCGDRARREPRAIGGDRQIPEAPVDAGGSHLEGVGEVGGRTAARDVDIDDRAEAESRSRRARAER